MKRMGGSLGRQVAKTAWIVHAMLRRSNESAPRRGM